MRCPTESPLTRSASPPSRRRTTTCGPGPRGPDIHYKFRSVWIVAEYQRFSYRNGVGKGLYTQHVGTTLYGYAGGRYYEQCVSGVIVRYRYVERPVHRDMVYVRSPFGGATAHPTSDWEPGHE